MRKVVYLGGPYTYKSKDKARRDRVMFLRYRVLTIVSVLHPYLMDKAVISPITQSHVQAQDLGETSWEFWADTDLALLNNSVELVFIKMPGWRESIGLQAEIAAAKIAQIPIVAIGIDRQVLDFSYHGEQDFILVQDGDCESAILAKDVSAELSEYLRELNEIELEDRRA